MILKLKNKRKSSSLNYIIEESEIKAGNDAHLSEVLSFIQLLTMIICGKSPSLLPFSYATIINRNDNQRHLSGYTWIENYFLGLQYVKIFLKTPAFAIDIAT